MLAEKGHHLTAYLQLRNVGVEVNVIQAFGVPSFFSDDGLHVVLSKNMYVTLNSGADRAIQAAGAGANQSIELDATQVDAGGVNNAYGVGCHVSKDRNYFYALWAGSDGTAGIWKATSYDADTGYLSWASLAHTTIPVSTSYHLRADCNGSRLRLFVNGVTVAEVQDGEYTSGGTAMFVSTYDESGIEGVFANLSVSKL